MPPTGRSSTGFLALLGHRRPWLLALAVGVWVPFYGALATHNFGSIVALVIALVGAYGGWVCRKAIVKIRHPA